MHNEEYTGPSMPLSIEIDEMKYRQQDESFDGKIKRIAGTLCDGPEHQYALEDVLGCLLYTSPSPRDS